MNLHTALRGRRVRTAAVGVAVAVACAAFVLVEMQPSGALATAAILGAGIVAGELLVLRWDADGELPLSYAVFLVVARGLDLRWAMATVVVAEAIAVFGRRPRAGRLDIDTATQRVAVGLATIFGFRGAFAVVAHTEKLDAVVAALLIGAASAACADGALRRTQRRPIEWSERAMLAWATLVSCGLLMAIADRGVGGAGRMGVAGAALLALPLLAAWFSFERVAAIRRAHRQTIEALSMAPELAGLVEPGTTDRVADLARAVGEHVGLTAGELETLDAAARLQHLGAVTLDDPAHGADALGTGDVARATAEMLRRVPAFAAAGEIVRRAGARRSVVLLDARGSLSANVLQKVSHYDVARAAGLDPASAIAVLRAADADRRSCSTIDALEFVLLTG